MVRKSKGRQRVEMVKMQKENNLQVTFSKRRTGLFKKASELSTLCGVDVAIVVFSPGKKVFSFGHPSVEVVVEKFLSGNNHPPVSEMGGAEPTKQLIEAHRNARVRELSMELTHVEGIIESEKKRSEAIDEVVDANCEAQGWMRAPYNELNLQQLMTLKIAMENLLKEIQEKAHQLMVMHGNGFPFSPLGGGLLLSGNRAGGSTPTAPRPPFGYLQGENKVSGLNFGSNGNSDSRGVGASPFIDGVAAASSAFPVNGFVASSDNVFTPREASTNDASRSGANSSIQLGIGRGFF